MREASREDSARRARDGASSSASDIDGSMTPTRAVGMSGVDATPRMRLGVVRLKSIAAVVRRTVMRVSTGTKPWAKRAMARVKREWAEQFPSDDVWAAEMDRLDELAAFEFEAASMRETSASSESAVGDGEICAATIEERLEELTLVATVASSENGVVDADVCDEVDKLEFDALCTPEKSTSFDERDYIYDEDEDEDEIKVVEGEQRVIVMPKVLVLEKGVLPQSDAVSFVAPKEDHKPRTFWRNNAARRRDSVPVIRVLRSPISPEAPIPERVTTGNGENITRYPDTPPWYQKRFDRETRELAKSARTLLDWAASATSELLADSAALVPVYSTAQLVEKTTYEPTWIDCGEDCLVVGLPVSNFVAQLDKAE